MHALAESRISSDFGTICVLRMFVGDSCNANQCAKAGIEHISIQSDPISVHLTCVSDTLSDQRVPEASE